MTVNQKVTGTASSVPAGLALGLLASLGVTLGSAGISAWLILGGTLGEELVGYCSMVILLLASASGAAVSIARIKRRRLLMGFAAGGIYFASLLAITALFFGGIYDSIGVTALMVLCGSALVILLGPGTRNRAGCRKRKKRP